jgi:predicted aconitase with swiveling domain
VERVIHGRPVVPGSAAGTALVSSEPLSFWGGYDHHNGSVIDQRHPLFGQAAVGQILAVPAARGSSTTTAVLLEALRADTAPAGLVTAAVEPFFALASIVAAEMYGKSIPVVAIAPEDFSRLRTGQWLVVRPDGTISVVEGARE